MLPGSQLRLEARECRSSAADRPSTERPQLLRLPTEQFLMWIAAVGEMPSKFGAELYLSLTQHLGDSVIAAAKAAAG